MAVVGRENFQWNTSFDGHQLIIFWAKQYQIFSTPVAAWRRLSALSR
jgi:hypothetical protein